MLLAISWLIIIFLIVVNGFFVAAEFAILGVRPSRVEQLADEGNATAIGLREVVRSPTNQDRYIATAQLGITVASLGLGMYGEPVIAHQIEGPLERWFGLHGAIVHTISFILALSLMTYLHVVIGEMIPKALALQFPERTVLFIARPMTLIQNLFSWAITALNNIGLLVLRLMRVPPPEKGSRMHTADELELIVSESVEGGLLEPEEQQLIANIFDFADRRVGQVMTPRTRIEAVPLTIEVEALRDRFLALPYSRLPVYEGSVDNIIGVVHLKDLLRHELEGGEFVLRELLRRAPALPESLPVEAALALLKRSRLHMAVVIDEYGGTAGIVTLEDLVEEVVGEVRDEFDSDESPPIRQIEPGHLVVQGSVLIDDLEPLLDLNEPNVDVETVGGLVLASLNRPPVEGDEITLDNITFRVEQVDGLAIERLEVRFDPEQDDDDPPES